MKADNFLSTAKKSPDALLEDLGPYYYLNTILEETPNGVMVVGQGHRVIHANPAASRFMGVPYGKLIGNGLKETLGEENADLFSSIRDHVIRQHQVNDNKRSHEIELIRGDKRYILNAVVVTPPSWLEYYLLYLIDITQQKKLEGELRRRNSFFHNLIDSSVDGIIASDVKGNIVLFNQGAQSLLGYSEEQVQSLHVTSLYNEGKGYELIQRMRSNEYGGKGKLLRHELIVKHRDGHDIPVSFSGGIIYDHGQEIATFGLFTDLRVLQQIEEDLEQSHKMLRQSEKMAGLGRLAAGVAHEINNPMSGIMLYANLIQEALGKDHAAHGDLQTIVHEAERCKVIVADLLEFSHQTTYEMNSINLNDVIQKTLAILQHQPLFQGVDIVHNLSQELPPIYGNTIRLNQVVMNIVVNAAQAMEGKGQISIISRTRANQELNEVTFQDTGPGIEADSLQQIFDPFFTTKAAGKGTGLGLSVSYAIVKEHKGSIRVTSTSQKGTTFSLRFPVIMDSLTGEDHG